MAHWMCTTCGYYLQTSEPPNRCPSCEQACVFTNVTCYRPGCEEQLDPVLMGNTLRLIKEIPERITKPKSTLPSEDIHLVDILAGLNEEQRQNFKSLGTTENYEANAVICTEGQESHKLYLVEKGQVAAMAQLTAGVRLPISIINTGHAFGWSALVPPYRYTATATTLFKTRVISFERKALLALMQANSALCLTIMQNIAGIIASRLRTVELTLAGLVQQR